MNISKIIKVVAGSIFSIFMLTVIFGSYYVIDEGERGVILRNGQVTGIAQPGMHFKMPMVERVVELSTRNHKKVYPQIATVSNDRQSAVIRASVNYRPTDVAEVYREYQSIENMEDRLINPKAIDKIQQIFAQYTAQDQAQKRGEMVVAMQKAITEAIDGPLTIESIQIEGVAFSSAYQESIEAQARQTVAANTANEKQRQEKTLIDTELYRAQQQAAGVLARAEAEAKAIRLRSDALRDSPRVVELTLAEKWDGKLPVTMVPGSSVPFVNVK